MVKKELELKLKAEICRDPDATKGHMHFRFADTACTVTDPKTEKKLGEINGCVGGVVELSDTASNASWHINPEEFWRAFQEALKDESTVANPGSDSL